MLLDARNPFVKTLSLDWWESFRKFLPKCPCWDGRAGLLQQPRGETRLTKQTVFTQMLLITWNLNPKTVRPFSCSRASETSSSWMFLWTMWSSIGYLSQSSVSPHHIDDTALLVAVYGVLWAPPHSVLLDLAPVEVHLNELVVDIKRTSAKKSGRVVGYGKQLQRVTWGQNIEDVQSQTFIGFVNPYFSQLAFLCQLTGSHAQRQ